MITALVIVLGLGSACGQPAASSRFGARIGTISARPGTGLKADLTNVAAGTSNCLFIKGRVVVVQDGLVLSQASSPGKKAPIVRPGAKADDVTYYCSTGPRAGHSPS
ncbi:MAG: hypothetical protein M3P18_21960 [Actinomycetota bacterium]|nr:hypothetical protein [Actinomycetota bacterium]